VTSKTKFLVGTIFLLLLAGILFILLSSESQPEVIVEPQPEVIVEVTPTTTVTTIGTSVESRAIEAHVIGSGENNLLFVGGVHGGYEWNSILLAYEMIDHFTANPDEIPENTRMHIIPNLNPDGLFLATGLDGRFEATDISSTEMHTTGEGRFNANGVDLNRNFACKWAPESSWRGRTVSAGTSAFSEPEAAALRDYVNQISPQVAVFWHSQANNVYASECESGVLPETLTVMNAYAIAGNYGAVPVFDAYPITGDAEGWLASINIPAVTVELETRTSIEWTRNLAGTKAVLEMYR
jgi:murein tripeptide amidase MpaA